MGLGPDARRGQGYQQKRFSKLRSKPETTTHDQTASIGTPKPLWRTEQKGPLRPSTWDRYRG
eukprot:4458860-Pyramimonas_sp.AAC.1